MLSGNTTGRKPSSRSQRFLQPQIDPDDSFWVRCEQVVSLHHPARWILQLVQQLDLSEFCGSYKGYGSLAFPADRLLAFVLYQYSQGDISPARWAKKACEDLPSIWLLQGLQPKRSFLYTFRKRCEPFLDGWLGQVTRLAINRGFTTAEQGALDGTFVAALASRHQLMSVRRLDRRVRLLRLLVWLEQGHDQPLPQRLEQVPQLLEMALALLLQPELVGVWDYPQQCLNNLVSLLQLLPGDGTANNPVRIPTWVPKTARGRQNRLQAYLKAQKCLEKRLAPLRQKAKLSKKEQRTLKLAKISVTDPEAALGRDKMGTYRPLYNVLLVQATDAPLTLSFEVLSRNNDDGLLRPMLEWTRQSQNLPLREILVDGAFLCVLDVLWCEQQDILVYGPPAKVSPAKVSPAAGGQPVGQQGQSQAAPKPPGKVVKLPKSAFRYEAEEGVYYCPEGKRLEELYRTTEKQGEKKELPVIVHRASGDDCQACPRAGECTSNAAKGRIVKRFVGEEALERVEKRMQDPAAQEVYRKRGQSVELGYADLKEHRGLTKFRCFDNQQIRAQAGLTILASNIIKLQRLVRQRENSPEKPAA